MRYTHQARDIKAKTDFIQDKHGLQSCFQQSVGQVLEKVLDAQSINLYFADFKSESALVSYLMIYSSKEF